MDQTLTTAESLDVAEWIDDLLVEIQRYLEAVALFRALDCAPSWRA
jgi:hypothetical protein